jgi:hypothetical protein
LDVLAGKLFQNLATLDIQQTATEMLQVGWQLMGEVISRVSFFLFAQNWFFFYLTFKKIRLPPELVRLLSNLHFFAVLQDGQTQN